MDSGHREAMSRLLPASTEGPWRSSPWWRLVPGRHERPTAAPRSPTTCAASLWLRRTDLTCLVRFANREPAAVSQADHRIENNLIARLHAVMHFDCVAEVTRDRDLLQTGDAVFDDRDVHTVLIEHHRVSRNGHRWRFTRDEQLDRTIDSRT